MTISFDANKVAPRFQNQSDKECLQKFHVVAFVDGEIRSIMQLGIFSGRSATATTIYANFNAWGLGDLETGIYTKGSGKVSGSGYNKHNAAAQDAIENAGFVGVSVDSGNIERTLLDMAKAYGYDVVKVVGG